MRVLVVDDSTLFRKVVRDVLSDLPWVEVVGVAANGRIALDKAMSLKPDLITLDIEMPEIDGLGVLSELKRSGSPCGAIMLSALSEAGASMTNKALELGAFDFVLKPQAGTLDENREKLRKDLLPRISAFAASHGRVENSADAEKSEVAPESVPKSFPKAFSSVPRVCLIGSSTGGPAALAGVLPAIPGDFPLPIVVVQHMPPVFTRNLAESLDRACPLKVVEAEDGMPIQPGTIFIAPGGRQAKIVRSGALPTIGVNDDPPENHCRPSVNYLLRSAINIYGGDSLTVILTGMGDDGTAGCEELKKKGARVIAQDRETCVVYGMPRSIIEAGLADQVVPLNRVAESIVAAAMGQVTCI